MTRHGVWERVTGAKGSVASGSEPESWEIKPFNPVGIKPSGTTRRGGPCVGKPRWRENLGNHRRLFDRRDEGQGAAALGTCG
ncbi:hypothetical protein [Candidatus Nitrospira salsa]